MVTLGPAVCPSTSRRRGVTHGFAEPRIWAMAQSLEFGGGRGRKHGKYGGRGATTGIAPVQRFFDGTINSTLNRETLVVSRPNKMALMRKELQLESRRFSENYVCRGAIGPSRTWVTTFPRTIYSSLSGGKPITDLVSAAAKKVSPSGPRSTSRKLRQEPFCKAHLIQPTSRPSSEARRARCRRSL